MEGDTNYANSLNYLLNGTLLKHGYSMEDYFYYYQYDYLFE